MPQTKINLRAIENAAHVGSWNLDFSTGIAVWSEEACRIYGYSSDDCRHTYSEWESFVHPDDLPGLKLYIENAQKSGQKFSVQHRIILRDGTIKEIFSTVEYLLNDEGQPTGLLGVVQDVTEIVKTRNALRQSEENVQLIFDLLPVSIYARRANGDYIFGNKLFLEHYGLSAAELKKKNIRDVVTDEAELTELLRQDAAVLASNEQLYVSDFKQKNTEGKLIHWRLVKIPFIPVGETDTAILGIAEDVTLENERIDALIHHSEIIAMRNKQLEDFSFRISHELRGPLTTIMSVIQIVDRVNVSPEDMKSFVVEMNNAAAKMDAVIRKLNEILSKERVLE